MTSVGGVYNLSITAGGMAHDSLLGMGNQSRCNSVSSGCGQAGGGTQDEMMDKARLPPDMGKNSDTIRRAPVSNASDGLPLKMLSQSFNNSATNSQNNKIYNSENFNPLQGDNSIKPNTPFTSIQQGGCINQNSTQNNGEYPGSNYNVQQKSNNKIDLSAIPDDSKLLANPKGIIKSYLSHAAAVDGAKFDAYRELCVAHSEEYYKSQKGSGSWATCHICNTTHAHWNTLQRHLQTHIDFRPFSCEKCNRTFFSQGKLKRHQVIHSDIKRYQCPVCDRRLGRTEHLKRHLLVHMEEKPYSCSSCTHTTKRLDGIRRHIKRKHGLTGAEIIVKSSENGVPIESRVMCVLENNEQECKTNMAEVKKKRKRKKKVGGEENIEGGGMVQGSQAFISQAMPSKVELNPSGETGRECDMTSRFTLPQFSLSSITLTDTTLTDVKPLTASSPSAPLGCRATPGCSAALDTSRSSVASSGCDSVSIHQSRGADDAVKDCSVRKTCTASTSNSSKAYQGSESSKAYQASNKAYQGQESSKDYQGVSDSNKAYQSSDKAYQGSDKAYQLGGGVRNQQEDMKWDSSLLLGGLQPQQMQLLYHSLARSQGSGIHDGMSACSETRQGPFCGGANMSTAHPSALGMGSPMDHSFIMNGAGVPMRYLSGMDAGSSRNVNHMLFNTRTAARNLGHFGGADMGMVGGAEAMISQYIQNQQRFTPQMWGFTNHGYPNY